MPRFIPVQLRVALLMVASLLALASPSARAEIVDRIAASVNDDIITWSEIYELGGEHIERELAGGEGQDSQRRVLEIEVLDVLIGRRLVEQEMRRLDLDVTDQDVERALGDIARQNGLDRAQLQSEVEASGLAWDDYLDELGENLREMKFNQQVLSPRITVRDDELRDAYRRSIASFTGPEQATLRVIFLAIDPGAAEEEHQAVLAQALELRERVAAGADFGDLAAEHSAEPYASRRGEMGSFQQGELVGELGRPAFSTPVGQVAEPISTAQGVFLMQVVDRVQPDPPAFEEVQDRLRSRLMEEKFEEAREQWLLQARRRSAVKVLLEPL